jgi:putative oxidoreductase
MLTRMKGALEAHGSDIGLLLLRLWFGLVLAFAHGWGKLGGFEGFSGYVAGQGFWLPEVAAGFAIAGELVAGVLLAMGVFFRPAAAAMALTMFAAAFVVHGDDPFKKMEFALAYAIPALALFFSGPGNLTIGKLLRRQS